MDKNLPTGETMNEGSSIPPETRADEAETADIPLSMLGDVSEGETVTVRVVSVNADAGTATITKAVDEPDASPSATDAMASEFDKEQPTEQA